MIPYSRQKIDTTDVKAVNKVLKQKLITTGPNIDNFEKAIIKKVNSKFAVSVNSATSALHIACLSLGLKKGDWFWTSPISFVASANCGLYCGAKVDFVDIDPKTYNLSIDSLSKKLEQAKLAKKLPKIVIPVSFAGQSCELSEIKKLSKIYKFKILEDSSHALGGKYKDQPIGNCKYADISVFSFHPVKMITTGEGGMAVTNDKKLFEKMKMLRSHGITRNIKLMKNPLKDLWYYEQHSLGYNYRMNDIQAALGISQLNKLKNFLQKRKYIFDFYNEHFKDLPIILPYVRTEIQSSMHLYVIKLEQKESKKTRNKLFNFLRKSGIGANLHYIPIHLQPFYRRLGFKKNTFTESEKYFEKALSIPIHPSLSQKNLNYINSKIRKFFN